MNDFLEILNTYFWGERTEALFFIVPIGVLSLVFAGIVYRTQQGGFMWGIVIPFVLLGLALLVTGAAVSLRTPGQVEHLTALYEADKAAFIAEEMPRMEQVNANWPRYVAMYVAFLVIGSVLRFAVHTEWALSAGTALILFAAIGLFIDGFAERRAEPYTKALEELSPRVAPGPE
ncbi:MAG: hypothetical protein OEM15_10635 [Myxococcales bacterium]|nr:hypothetical protein [Myxococcales bacterium]MDH3482956.1 hypothetical protein [Myxococcales bacterium]